MRARYKFAFLTCLALLAGGCDEHNRRVASAITGGDAHKGEVAIEYYGCASCHTIPGVPGADGMVGPPLAQISQRAYVGGVLRNTPKNLVQWIKDPPAIDAKTAMPSLNIPDADAKDIASYLYTLK